MFRKINKNDKEFYITSVKAFYSSDAVLHGIPDEYIIKTFEELMKSDVYAEAFIIEKDNQKAGYALVSKTFSQEAGGMVLWLEELYILSEFRSCGLGGEFLKFLKENSSDYAVRLRLELCQSNVRACEVYKRHGFEIFDYKQMVCDKL